MTIEPDWDDLRVLLAVARHGSLNGAARILGLTQPTVSRRVAAFEGRLGIQMFDRDTYGMVPTAACAGLLENLERMDVEAQGVLRKLAAAGDGLEGTLTVTSIDWLGAAFVAPLLARFGARHPGLTLRLINEKRNFNLAAREADLSVAFRRVEQDNLVQRRLATVDYSLFAAPGYIARHGLPDLTQRGRGHHVVLVEPQDDVFLHDAWIRAVLPDAHVALRTGDMHTVVATTVAGEAIGHLPRPLGESCADLRRLSAPAADPGLDLRLGFHVDMRDNIRLRALVDFLAAELPPRLAPAVS
jgi:DNA-binding transcriptional LysR family regulator